jgi:Asp-tRNA(Asn)/Glu-tRNA(Gln) amidotransferase A subunit family amidase
VRSRLDVLRDRNRPGYLLRVGGNFLAAAIRAKDLSPVELLRGVHARLHGVNDRTNAFYTLTEALLTSPRFAPV